jgi:hypothetical protein
MVEYTPQGRHILEGLQKLSKDYSELDRRLPSKCEEFKRSINSLGNYVEKEAGLYCSIHIGLELMLSTCEDCIGKRTRAINSKPKTISLIIPTDRACPDIPNKIKYLIDEMLPEIPKLVKK